MNVPFEFGFLIGVVGLVMFVNSEGKGKFAQYFNKCPTLVWIYFLPAICSSLGIIGNGDTTTYEFAINFMLPGALILLTLSINLQSVFILGPRALGMFFAGTLGIMLGGPIALLLYKALGGPDISILGENAIWRGLATIAGSWIGGGANQAAMLEIYQYSPENYGNMVIVDIVFANLWMSIIFFGIIRKEKLNKWFKADEKELLPLYTENTSDKSAGIDIKHVFYLLSLIFFIVGSVHLIAEYFSNFLLDIADVKNSLYLFLKPFLSSFFWVVTFSTFAGIILSFGKSRNFESNAKAGNIGSFLIYLLVATIGMRMELGGIFDNPWLLFIGATWMMIHVIVLIIFGKILRTPFFYLAVGSQANVGGVASAPVVAAAFHPKLASIGVILSVLGYVVGTYGAIVTAELMRIISTP